MRRFALALSMVAVACSRPDYDGKKPESMKVAATAAAAAPAASSALIPDVPDAPPPPLRFEDVGAELETRCRSGGARDELERSSQCRKLAVAEEMDRFLLPLKDAKDKRYAGFVAHQGEWSRFVDAACLVAEASHFTDFDAGTRDDTGNRSIPVLSCKNGVLTERFFFARTRATGDITALARWVIDAAPRGELAKRGVTKLRAQADALVLREEADAEAPQPDPDGGTKDAGLHKLDGHESKTLAQRVAYAQLAPPQLARATCDVWPELSAELGGDAVCREKLTLYYFAHVPYGKTY